MTKAITYAEYCAMFIDLNDVIAWGIKDDGRPTFEVADSVVAVFTPAEAKPPPEIRPFIEAMQRVTPHHDDLFSPESIHRYFNEVYWQRGEKRLAQI